MDRKIDGDSNINRHEHVLSIIERHLDDTR